MVEQIKSESQEKMNKAVESLKKEYTSIRAGRANPSLLDKVTVDYYGSPTPINQVGNISAPEARLLLIQPWDKTVLGTIEKAIMKSDLGLTPTNDGNVIRISIPQLTQERRTELVKQVKKKAEEYKVIVRNIRRDSNDDIKNLQKNNEISEDEAKRSQEDIQKLTDKYIKELDLVAERKEQEIMEV